MYRENAASAMQKIFLASSLFPNYFRVFCLYVYVIIIKIKSYTPYLNINDI